MSGKYNLRLIPERRSRQILQQQMNNNPEPPPQPQHPVGQIQNQQQAPIPPGDQQPELQRQEAQEPPVPFPPRVRDLPVPNQPAAQNQPVQNQPNLPPAPEPPAEHIQPAVPDNPEMAQPVIHNPMSVAFKPVTFNGLHPESASRWWKSFMRYATLSNVQGNDRCNLLGLLLSGSCELWFNSLPEQTRNDFAALEAAFREKYITAAHTQLQRQMAILSRVQTDSESVDEYVLASRSQMEAYNYDPNLQITLLINGLKSELKAAVMQHLPFENMEAFITKAKHIESALKLKSQTPMALSTYTVNVATEERGQPVKQEVKRLEDSVNSLAEKFDGLSRKLFNWKSNATTEHWRNKPSYQRNVRFNTPPVNSYSSGTSGANGRNVRCWHCNTIGHIRSKCPNYTRPRYPFGQQSQRPEENRNFRYRSPSPGPQRQFQGN